MSKPAILGGNSIFSTKLHIVKPVVPHGTDLLGEIQEVLQSGFLTKGPHLENFESAVAKSLGVDHVVAVSSATIGLMLTYQGLNLTGEVIVPSFTFMATVSAMVWAGLKPVFVDVGEDTCNIDVNDIESHINANTSAIVAVHTFGAPANLVQLEKIAKKHDLKLIVDSAHGFGTLYNGGSVATYGDAHIYSLSPTKLVIAGEGGIVATNNGDLARTIRLSREYGNNGKYDSVIAGLNGRMPEINALVGLHSLRQLDAAVSQRNKIAQLFKQALSKVPGVYFQELENQNDRSSFKDFSIVVRDNEFGIDRDTLVKVLQEENIDTRNYYDPPVHRQQAYKQYGFKSHLPITDFLASSSVSVPLWSHMTEDVALKICEAIERAHMFAQAIRELNTHSAHQTMASA